MLQVLIMVEGKSNTLEKIFNNPVRLNIKLPAHLVKDIHMNGQLQLNLKKNGGKLAVAKARKQFS